MPSREPTKRRTTGKVTKQEVTAQAIKQSTKLDAVAAIVEDTKKPNMSEAMVKPRLIKGKIVNMADDPSPSKATRNTMDPVPKPSRKRPTAPLQLGEQMASEEPVPEQQGLGYFRIRLSMIDGVMTARSAKFVEGPLLEEESVSPGITYDAKIGQKRVAFGDVPDPTEWRSHPDPSAKGERAGHHVTELSSYDFTVRIPSDQVTEKTIEDLRVTLYRWRGKGPGEHISISELSREPKSAVETLGAMSGMQIADAPAPLKKELRQAFKEAGTWTSPAPGAASS